MEIIKKTSNGQAMYTILKDGHGGEHKIVNFDNPEMVPQKGVIVIEALRKGQTRHKPSSNFRTYRDATTGIIWGVPQGLNQQKNILYQLFEWGDIRQYDLSMVEDRKEWAVMQYHPSLLDSVHAKGKPAFKKLDVEAEATTKIKRVTEREAAYKIIKDLTHMQMLDMARNCGGIDTLNNSMTVIQSKLFDFAETKPEEFNRIWTMTNRQALTVFKRCLHVGLISFDLGIGFLWKKATQLGNSESMAIDFITKNHSLLVIMDAESKLSDGEFQKNATEAEKNEVIDYVPQEEVKKPEERDMIAYNKHLEERLLANDEKMNKLMAILEKGMTAKPLDLDAPAPVPAEIVAVKVVTDPVASVLTPEEIALKALQKKANELGMKHAFVTKDPAKIHAWMKAKEDGPVVS